jgi:N-acyl-L-homoserine lactone synthetase
MAPVTTGTSRQARSTVSELARSETSFSDNVAQLLDRIDYRRVDVGGEERESISRLRYEAYLREGAISPNHTRTFSDSYDETENGYLFGLYLDGELASSIRIHVGSREHPDFPSLEVFSDVLQPELDAGKLIVDSTRFVTDENLSRLHRGLPYATLRLCWLAVEHFSADHFLAAIRVEHQAFYRRTFRHRLICEPRPYPKLAKPISLMTAHYPTSARDVYRRYPFFRSTFFERRMLYERGATQKLPPSEEHLTPHVSEAPRLAG